MSDAPLVRNLAEVAGVPCPCGTAHRVIRADDDADVSVHWVEIELDSAVHYHTRLTEIYVVARGSGTIELDGASYPLSVGTMVRIPPGVRHRATPGPRGLTVVNIVRPPFDPEDEHHDP